MPTLYTALRARHRHKIAAALVALPEPQPAPLQPQPKSLLALERSIIERSTLAGIERVRKKPTRRVAVVGAGFAGLCAAYELDGLGYDVTVFEARDRVGGRVHSLKDFIRGKFVEGGAELIGSNHPLWNSYKQHFRLQFTDVRDYGNSPIRFGKRTLTFEQSSELIDEMEKQLKALTQRAAAIVDPFEPWTNRDAQRLDSVSLGQWINGSKSTDLCKKAIANMLEADNGVPANEQSLLGVLAMIKGGGLDRYWTDTEVFRCQGGSQQLADKLCEGLNRKRRRVLTQARVSRISRQDRMALIRVNIEGQSTTTEVFDDVILAVPPSVWDKIEFRDSVLAARLRASPQMGSNVKYLMCFHERFWEEFGSSPTLTEDGPVDLTWETTEGDISGDYTMVTFSGSIDATTCSSWKPASRKRCYIKSMQTPYPGMGPRMKTARFMDWPNERWSKASYYFPRLNEVTKWGPFWKAGYDGWLHFAGEHTCYAFVGYMEGALSSGYRLARRLAVRDRVFTA